MKILLKNELILYEHFQVVQQVTFPLSKSDLDNNKNFGRRLTKSPTLVQMLKCKNFNKHKTKLCAQKF